MEQSFDRSASDSLSKTLLPLQSRRRAHTWHDNPIADLAAGDELLCCRTASDLDQVATPKAPPASQTEFWPVAVSSLILGVASIAPYGLLLAADPECPLFISFNLHLCVVLSNVWRAGTLLRHRKIPVKYHAAIVLCGFSFNALKSDAFARLPPSVCMLLLNLRMFVAVIVQFVVYGERCSVEQLAGVLIVSCGVVWAGWSVQAKEHPGTAGFGELVFGTGEILGAMLALSLLSCVVKAAFSRYGERIEEQMFIQHFFSLPLFLCGGQWHKIGPRLVEWLFDGSQPVRLLLLLTNVLLTAGGRAATVRMAGRAPNLLVVQLVQTLEKFLQLLTMAMLRAPPFPPAGFWGGSSLLAAGTLQFLAATEKKKAAQKL